MLLFHGVYGRMYSLFLFTSTLSYLALLAALDAAACRRWALWALAVLAAVATHPYGALVLASQGRVRAARPAAAARRAVACVGRGVLGIPLLAHRPGAGRAASTSAWAAAARSSAGRCRC